MSYDENKKLVLIFFDEHINKYIVKDLEALNNIKADRNGDGGCVIPQAISTFAALDLIGYLIHPQDIKVVDMSFSDFLKNENYFPKLMEYKSHLNFFNSIRDNIRSIMVHRFLLSKYDIVRSVNDDLFFQSKSGEVFNVFVLTNMVITVIEQIYQEINLDTFIINGYSKEKTLEKMKEKINKLINFEKDSYEPLSNLKTPVITPQTTPRPII